jgi:hypothetical protein
VPNDRKNDDQEQGTGEDVVGRATGEDAEFDEIDEFDDDEQDDEDDDEIEEG